jgi:hypothetical protein
MKKLLLCIGIFSLCYLNLHAQTNAASNKTEDKYLRIAHSFLDAKQRSWQQEATAADIDKVLYFCSDTVRYDHKLSPEKEFSFSGKDLWQRGAVSHLGETRNVKISLLKTIQRQNVVMIEFTISREVKNGDKWEPSPQTIVSVMEFDKGDKLKKITDYL